MILIHSNRHFIFKSVCAHNTLENTRNYILPLLKPVEHSMSQIVHLGNGPVYRGSNVKVVFFFLLRCAYIYLKEYNWVGDVTNHSTNLIDDIF